MGVRRRVQGESQGQSVSQARALREGNQYSRVCVLLAFDDNSRHNICVLTGPRPVRSQDWDDLSDYALDRRSENVMDLPPLRPQLLVRSGKAAGLQEGATLCPSPLGHPGTSYYGGHLQKRVCF